MYKLCGLLVSYHRRVEAQTCHAAIAGTHLVTVDVCPAVGRSTHGANWCLRMWDAGPLQGPPFVLNSTFDNPHGYAAVVQILLVQIMSHADMCRVDHVQIILVFVSA